ncbi:hypothetical protein CI610_03314 [invertebrate metagenome]|uniref:Uncharacterized protein n=1 Tax=invertebrate metagenome TaxID=1711999 RepID=A0A2H9T3E7_9ZZZZ
MDLLVLEMIFNLVKSLPSVVIRTWMYWIYRYVDQISFCFIIFLKCCAASNFALLKGSVGYSTQLLLCCYFNFV